MQNNMMAEHWQDEAEYETLETMARLRHAFPDTGNAGLRAMALRHPATAKRIRYCRRCAAAYRRPGKSPHKQPLRAP